MPIPLENKGEDLLTELKWYTTNWEGKGSTFLKICIQFKNGGEYLIAVFTNGHYVNGYHHFQFFVKIKNGEGEKCFFKNFKNMSEEDLEILEDYRKEMEIVIVPKNVIEDKKRGIENFGLLTDFLNVNLGLSPDPLKQGSIGNEGA